MRVAIMVAALLAGAAAQAQQLEKRDVHIAVGGKASFYYLPLTIAEQLGYFKDEGLNVKISDFAGGSVALRAVVGGSADVVSGAYEHTISLQSKKQYFQAFVLQGRLPQIAFGVATSKASRSASARPARARTTWSSSCSRSAASTPTRTYRSSAWGWAPPPSPR
jgi:NitT/TauT family transport system substrate-binding protein